MSIYNNLVLEQAEIIELLWQQNRRLITIAAQVSDVTKEEKRMQEIEKRMGGIKEDGPI